jgi:hypothetical protein
MRPNKFITHWIKHTFSSVFSSPNIKCSYRNNKIAYLLRPLLHGAEFFFQNYHFLSWPRNPYPFMEQFKTGLGQFRTGLGQFKIGLGQFKTGLGQFKTGISYLQAYWSLPRVR